MNQRQQELYQQVILEHNRKPRNYGPLPHTTHSAEGYNPLCGDHIWIEINSNDQKINEIHFRGDGCAICKASASMMTVALTGKSFDEAQVIIRDFKTMVKGEFSDQLPNTLGRLAIFAGIGQYPARVKCAVLAWYTADGAMANQSTITTE